MTVSRLILLLLFARVLGLYAQSEPYDYWLINGFADGDTVITNDGFFFDDGGNDVYQENQDWEVTFCSENGNPITLDFMGFATHFGGVIGDGTYGQYDYMTIDYPGAGYVAYNDDTPTFSFTSQSTCITFGFHSDGDGLVDSGWVAEIYAVPPPFNNDPADAEELVVGNICSPSFYTNKGAYNSTGLGSPPCKTYFGGDVWFTLIVPPSGILKIETFPLTLEYAILDIFSSSDGNILTSERIACVDDNGVMPAVTLSSPTVSPGERLYIRLFGEQAKSGLFGICATDPSAPVTGFTGPGGVGDSLSLDFWFLPEDGILNGSGLDAADGDAVGAWTDQSGNERDLEQLVSGQRPQYNDNVLNGFGMIGFDGSDDQLFVEAGSGDAPLHWFAVGGFSGSQRQTMFSIGDESASKTASVGRHSDGRYFSFTTSDLFGPFLADGQNYLLHAIHNNVSPLHDLQLNGQSQPVDDEIAPLESDGSFTLGAAWDDSDPFNGSIAELIQFRKTLNSAQQIIINNYLAAKYDLPLNDNDLYSFRNSFHFDVAGIGRVDENNQHTKAQSAGILAVSSASDLDNGEFLFFGHDNGDFQSWTTVNVPENDTNIVRLERLWRIDIEGDPGTVTFTLDKSDIPPLPDDFIAYNIIIDQDTDLTAGAETYGPFELGSELVINNAVLSHGDYLAIAAVRPVISFLEAESEALESVVNPTIEVGLNYAISSIVDIDYQVTSATATQGIDYSLNASTITINPGSKVNYIIPLIIDDDQLEIPDEYFDIDISSSTAGVAPAGIIRHRHTILNDDIELQLSRSKDTIGECPGSTSELTVTANGTGPFAYSWTPSAGILDDSSNDTITVSPAATTLYTVEVTDGLGTVFSDTIRVHVMPAPAKPVITADGSTDICEGDSVRLFAPSGYVSYLWSTGQTSQDIWVTAAGSYNLSVADAYGCFSEVSEDITLNILPLPDPPAILADGPLSFCPGGSVTLEGEAGYASYEWSDGYIGQSRMVNEVGDFAIRAADINGCISDYSDSVTVTENPVPPRPEITPSGVVYVITGDSTVLSASSANGYLWSPGGETTQEITVKSSGTFSVFVENEFGCLSEASDEVEVVVSDFLPPPLVSASGPLAFCEGGSVTLSGEDGYAVYRWSDGQTGQSIEITASGTLTLTVEDGEGNESLASDEILITVYDLPEPTLAEAVEPLCYGDENGRISITVSGGSVPYSYAWSNGSTEEDPVGLSAGSYTVTVTDANECQGLLDIALDQPAALDVRVNAVPAYCPDFSDGQLELIVTGGTMPYSYDWDGGGNTAVLSDLSPGAYAFTVTDANGCSHEGTGSPGYINDVCFVIPGIITPNNDGYNDTWYIEGLEVYPDVTIDVFDRWGRRVFHSEGHETHFDGTFNGRELPMESYHYIIDLNNGTEKIVGNITIIRGE